MVRRDAGLDQKEGASPFIYLRPVLHPYLIHVGPTADDTQRHRQHRQHPSHPQQYALHVAPTYAAAPTLCSHVSRWSSTWLMRSSCLLRRLRHICALLISLTRPLWAAAVISGAGAPAGHGRSGRR